jgi:hypothetical protein
MLNTAYTGARGVDGTLHFPVQSMNRHNQTENFNFAVLGFLWRFLFLSILCLTLNRLIIVEIIYKLSTFEICSLSRQIWFTIHTNC